MTEEPASALWADILALVIRLNDREADAAFIGQLRAADAPMLFQALLTGTGDEPVAEAFAAALEELRDPPDAAMLDEMAADYADLYLTHGHRIAPTGSVWLTEDHLERQEPMFEVREWYDHYGMQVPNWRIRSDDHLVHELQFVQHLVTIGTPATLGDAAKFLDRHVLGWLPDFCGLAGQRARTPFHATATVLSSAVLLALRDWLAEATGVAPDIRANAYALAEDRARRAAEAREIERPFVPGLEPSW